MRAFLRSEKALGLAATQLTKKKKASHAELHLDGCLEGALATDCPVRRAPPTVEWKALIRIQEIHTRSYKDTAQSDSKCAGRRVLLWIFRFRGMNRIPIISYAFLLATPLVTCLSLPQPIQLCWHSTLAKINGLTHIPTYILQNTPVVCRGACN